MATVDSKLASEFIASPSHQNGRKYPITRVTIHHTATVTTARVKIGRASCRERV